MSFYISDVMHSCVHITEDLYRGGHYFFEHPHPGAATFYYGYLSIQFFRDYSSTVW